MNKEHIEQLAKEHFESLKIDRYLFGKTKVIELMASFAEKLIPLNTDINPTGLPDWIVDLTDATRTATHAKPMSDLIEEGLKREWPGYKEEDLAHYGDIGTLIRWMREQLTNKP